MKEIYGVNIIEMLIELWFDGMDFVTIHVSRGDFDLTYPLGVARSHNPFTMATTPIDALVSMGSSKSRVFFQVSLVLKCENSFLVHFSRFCTIFKPITHMYVVDG